MFRNLIEGLPFRLVEQSGPQIGIGPLADAAWTPINAANMPINDGRFLKHSLPGFPLLPVSGHSRLWACRRTNGGHGPSERRTCPVANGASWMTIRFTGRGLSPSPARLRRKVDSSEFASGH